MTGLFNLRTRLALFAAALVIAALGSVYGLSTRLANELNTAGYQQDLSAIENRVSSSWQLERDALLGTLHAAVYDQVNAAQIRAGGVKDLLLRMTLTMGVPRAWVMNSDEQVIAQAGAGSDISAAPEAVNLGLRAFNAGKAADIVVTENEAHIVATVRLNDGDGRQMLYVATPIDETLARTLTERTGTQMGFYKFSPGGAVTVLGAQIESGLQAELTEAIRAIAAKGVQSSRDLTVGDLRFRLSLIHQADAGNIYTGILPSVRPVGDKVQSFLYTVGVIAAVALALALAGGLVFGQRLTGALTDLTQAARQISNGRYDVQVQVRSSDELGRFVESFNLLSESLKQREAKMFQTAHRDTVTGLPSRALFENELVDIVGKARGRGDSLALITVVVDRLREVNDSLGRKAGDSMLSEIGDRLRRSLKKAASDADLPADAAFIARLATYEFGIILPEADAEQTEIVTNQLSEVLARRVEFEHQTVLPNGRIGVALFPDHGMDPRSLLYSADIAASHAQAQLTNIAVFDPSFEEDRERQLGMLGELNEALKNNELHVAMQPKINLQKDGVLMAEALMRWEHPERGAQNPAEFVPFAEKTGFITQLTNWMIDAALAKAAQYVEKGVPLGVAVNLSPRDLGSPDFTTYVVERLRAHKLRGSTLTLEVTEQAVVNASPIVRQNLDVLWRLGVKIAIDDFGSGFATLEQLRSLPLSYLKIDRQYVNGLINDEASRIVVKSSIDLGHAIGVEVVAEGVETTEQLEALRTLNCDQAQGYFVGKPLGDEDFAAWVENKASNFDVSKGRRPSARRSGGKAALVAAAAAAAGSAQADATAAAPAPQSAVTESSAPEVPAVATVAEPTLSLADEAAEAGLSFELPAEPTVEPTQEIAAPESAEPPQTSELSLEPAGDSPADGGAGEMPPLNFDLPDLVDKS